MGQEQEQAIPMMPGREVHRVDQAAPGETMGLAGAPATDKPTPGQRVVEFLGRVAEENRQAGAEHTRTAIAAERLASEFRLAPQAAEAYAELAKEISGNPSLVTLALK